MNTTHILPVLALLPCFGAFASAQVNVPVNPRATYLRTVGDTSAVPAPAIPLSALGVSAGQWLRIATTGAYSDGGGADNQRGLTCVFSSSVTLLPDASGLVARVPGAVTAGAVVTTPNTYSSNQTTDIPQDFIVGRTSWENGIYVRVPATATHLFVSVLDPNWGFFGNNADPNNDFTAVFTAAAPPALHGTQEHCDLRTAVGGTPASSPQVKPASPFSTVSVEVHQRFGLSNGQIYGLVGDLFSTGGAPPIGALPNLHMGANCVVVSAGVVSANPGLWSFFVPPGYAGTTVILQGVFLNPSSRNGLLEISDAHRIELQ
jgi:hypothetical protein